MEKHLLGRAESESIMRRTERNKYSSQVNYQTYGRQEPPHEGDELEVYPEESHYGFQEEQNYDEEPTYGEGGQRSEVVSTSQAIN